MCPNTRRRGRLAVPGNCETVEALCEATGVDPGSLCLEITESVLIDDVPGAHSAFDGLKRVGVRLVLDDFGTGYCSLSYLSASRST